MIKLRLTPYASTVWTWNGRGYVTADRMSEIVPYDHPLVEHIAVTDGVRTLLVVRECVAGRESSEPTPRNVTPGEFDEARTLAELWPTDYVLVETAPGDPCRVTAGPEGIAPLYVAHDDTSLHGSWDMADLAEHAADLRPIDRVETALHLTGGFDSGTVGTRLAERYPGASLPPLS